MSTPVRRLWLMRSSFASAYALPYTNELFFSERLLSLHPDDEVAAVCAHEIGHLGESKGMLAARGLGILVLVPWLLLGPLLAACGLAGLIMTTLLRLLVFTGSRRLSVRLEQRADRMAHAHEANPGAFARALARLHEENLVPAVLPRKRYSHPDLYDRLTALGVQPDCPRPAAPSAMAWPGRVFAALLGALAVLNCMRLLQ